jgi:two-component system alkaline phosphatase synthesis response regulator PhoP
MAQMIDNSKVRILLVDEDKTMLDAVDHVFRRENYEISSTSDPKDALEIIHTTMPHLIIMETKMRNLDGFQLCEQLRSEAAFAHTIIIFLSKATSVRSQIEGLELGADDYLTKPISPKLLLVKAKTLLRKMPIMEVNRYIVLKDMILDIENYTVTRNDKTIPLCSKEFKLLMLLISDSSKIFHRDEIYHALWDDGLIVKERTIDVHVRRIRKKAGITNIKTIRKVGYQYQEKA